MKDLKLIVPLLILLVITIIIESKQENNLQPGDFAFTSFKAIGKEGFSFVTFKDIKPNSIIYFTDSKWNGNHFAIDEGTLIWNSGDDIIKTGMQIVVNNTNTTPVSNYGSVKNTLKLSKFSDAIFAYTGSASKVPDNFIAAVSNNVASYGTLINTGLINGKTAITYPKNTCQASYLKTINISDKNILLSLNNMSNYMLNSSSNKYSNNQLADIQ